MSIVITHDGPLDIATGRSRTEVNWKNKSVAWTVLLAKLAKTQRTHESFAEYLASKKPRQDEIKDVGGFVGGYLSGGKRGKGSVNYRQLVTLDVDFAPAGIWDDFTLLYGCAAAVYSTHKHGPDKPRLRLIIPLDRHVLCDEYTAIARRIAGTLGIEYFDDTTYQPERLMYWPSTSKDGEYVFEYQDGPWLSADEVLGSYRDWKDTSEWPVSDREGTAVWRDIKKQGDPLEKHGVVGAFCRTFTIHEAIEVYLSDVYTPCDIEGRYSYAEGTTSAGMITYDDKYAYSHHGTDPISMKLCNAFDLVRIHLFGLKDENVNPATPVTKTPSHGAMEDLARKEGRVRKLLVDEKLHSAQADFESLTDDGDTDGLTDSAPVNDDWKGELDCDKKGNILSTVDNAVLVIENAPELKGRFAFDEFRMRPVVLKNLPWRKVSKISQYVTDQDEDNLYHHLEKFYGMNSTKLDKVMSVIYTKHTFHPVRDYLNTLTWDKQKRCDTLFIDYVGAADIQYTLEVTRKMLVAAVARIFQPGIKFDTVLMLLGEEGKYKSTIFNKLGRDWFTDNFNFGMIKGKEGCEQLLGYWIVEIGEMAGFKKADRNEAKSFIARQIDSYRPAYGRNTVTYPRQSILVSTSNPTDPLHENEGNRRFWPVQILKTEPTKSVKDDLTPAEVDQIWAEAVTLFRKGETVYLSPEMEKVAKEVQRAHTEEHPWTGVVIKYLDTLLPEDWSERSIYERLSWLHSGDTLQIEGTVRRRKVCIPELWCEALGKAEKDMTTFNTKDLHAIMRSLSNWEDAEQLRYGMYGQQRRGYSLRTDVTVTSNTVSIKALHKN